MPTELSSKVVTTRKVHQCHGCCHDIPAGSQAERSVNLYDNRVYSLYYCLDCVKLLPFVNFHELDEGLQTGDLYGVVNWNRANEKGLYQDGDQRKLTTSTCSTLHREVGSGDRG